MENLSGTSLFIILLLSVSCLVQIQAANKPDIKVCNSKSSPCFKKKIPCPYECPSAYPTDPKAKVCYVNCNSPICKAECRNKKPNCNGPGSACLDPRFIGGDGIVFYFHGKRNEHFSLVSDQNLQINARFIGLRPAGRARDYTWIQALGLLFDSNTFSVEATPASTWDDQVDHLRFSFNGQNLVVPDGHMSYWECPETRLRVQRTSSRNSVMVDIPEVAEVSVNVVPVTKEDDRIHNYQIPQNDCFAHLEVQFRFHGLSSKVEGVLGRTYQPDFENPAKPGVAMPVVGGEDRYKTTSLLSGDCGACIFSPVKVSEPKESTVMKYLDCSGSSMIGGNGIVCRK
ncbi:Root cap [Parasponia andersonii]|uniref:Root cap n=1 Tax=Parasponia andersonii TaxID=3476 RepID=A0A2P5B747_PARAD|nr:Root cap [Parasponia andersonii]